MNLNMQIVADELSVPASNISLDDSTKLYLSNFQLLGFELPAELSGNKLYIVDASDIPEHIDLLFGANLILIGHINSDILLVLKEQACNIILLEKLSMPAAVNKIQIIFNKYSIWNERLLSVCLTKKSLKEIFDVIAEVFTNPIFVLNSSLVLMLTAGKVPENIDNSFWEYVLPHGYFSFTKLTSTKHPTKYEEYFNLREPVWLRKHETEHPYILTNLFLNNIKYGTMVMPEVYEPLTIGQLSLFEYSKVIVETFLESMSNRTLNTDDSSFVITHLIRGIFVDEELIVKQLNKNNWKIEEPYYVICLAKQKDVFSDEAIDFYLSTINQVFSKGIMLNYGRSIIIILRDKDYPYLSEENCLNLLNSLKNVELKAGISQMFYDFKYLRSYYKQSRIAVDYGRKLHSEKQIYYFRDYCFIYIADSFKPEVKKEIICDPRIMVLMNYDIKNKTNLVATLLTYLNCGSKLQQTADKLYIHRNTLSYRLNQIRKIALLDLESEENIDQIIFSCILMHGNSSI